MNGAHKYSAPICAMDVAEGNKERHITLTSKNLADLHLYKIKLVCLSNTGFQI